MLHTSVKLCKLGSLHHFQCIKMNNQEKSLNFGSESSLRGVFMAMSGIAATLGFFIVYLLGSVTEWRNVALCGFVVPLITMIAVCFVRVFPKDSVDIDRTTYHKFLRRFQKRRCGYCRKVAPKMHRNRYNGYAAGYRLKQSKKNLTK